MKKSLDELCELIKALEYEKAFDKFYDDNIVTHENEKDPINGLPAYREAGKVFFGNLSNYSAELQGVLWFDNISVCHWHYRFEHKQWGTWDRQQVSVQRWENGRIMHERHYYKE